MIALQSMKMMPFPQESLRLNTPITVNHSNTQFLKSICNALIDGMDKCLLAVFCCNHVNHAVLHNLNTSFQRSQFPTILQAMQMADDEVQSISTIARSSVIGQAFKTNVLAYPSQAKCTRDRYSNGYQSKGGKSSG